MYKERTDKLIRGLALDGTVRIVVVDSSEVAEKLRQQHDAGPVGAVGLSRVATAALLLSATLKERQQVGVQVNGDGPLGEIYAIADESGTVRATIVNPRASIDFEVNQAIPIEKGIGMGRLTVTRSLDDGAPYRGVVPIVDGGIASDLAEYFLSSEQTPTAVLIGEYCSADGIQAAGGLMVQALPDCDAQQLERIVKRMDGLPSIGEMFRAGIRPTEVLDRIFDNFEPMKTYALRAHCACTKEHFARRLVALGDATLTSLVDEGEEVRVECHFCRSEYGFTPEEVSALLYGARLYFPDDDDSNEA